MDKKELEERTRRFALRVVSFVSMFPRDRPGDVLGRQLLKSGTSLGANYREANRAESRIDFIHKIAIVEKEAAETLYWLELCDDAKIGKPNDRGWLMKESDELLAIFTSVGKTSKLRFRSSNPKSEIRNPKSAFRSSNPKSQIRNPKS